MRVISGEKRGKKLFALEGMDVRPTTDRVKESLFNILQFDIMGRSFLDLFAGSGQMGIEALSRGAKDATLVDGSLKSIEICKKNVESTQYTKEAKIVNSDSIKFLENTNLEFDIAFLDPPYSKGLLQQAMPLLVSKMKKGGCIACEHPKEEVLEEQYGDFVKQKTYKYGKIMLTLYRCKSFSEGGI